VLRYDTLLTSLSTTFSSDLPFCRLQIFLPACVIGIILATRLHSSFAAWIPLVAGALIGLRRYHHRPNTLLKLFVCDQNSYLTRMPFFISQASPRVSHDISIFFSMRRGIDRSEAWFVTRHYPIMYRMTLTSTLIVMWNRWTRPSISVDLIDHQPGNFISTLVGTIWSILVVVIGLGTGVAMMRLYLSYSVGLPLAFDIFEPNTKIPTWDPTEELHARGEL